MFTVVEQVRVDRDPVAVFAFLTTPGNRARWDPTVVGEELVSPPPAGVGSVLRTRMRMLGQELDYVLRITGHEPPHRMSAESVSGAMPIAMRFDVAPDGDGSIVQVSVDAAPSGMMRLAEPMIEGAVRSTLAAGLARAAVLMRDEA